MSVMKFNNTGVTTSPQKQSATNGGRGGTMHKYKPKKITDTQAHLRKIEQRNRSGADLPLSDLDE